MAGKAPLFVVSGPSGVGKGTLLDLLRRRVPELTLCVSATTRRARPGERDGVDYHFLSEAEFDRRLADGEFVESASYAGCRYGTLRYELEAHRGAGQPVLLEIDVEGVAQLRDQDSDGCFVFLAPPSLSALRERLEARGTETAAQVDARVRRAEIEWSFAAVFDHVVVNDRVDRALDELEAVVRAGAC